MPSGDAVAAIDCGTNSTRLLVADADGRPVERLMRITRLGQGVDATGRLAPEAIDRCVAVLAEYRQVMDRLGVGRGRLAATSAARDAANGADFLRRAGEVTGLEPELLTGLDEGRLSLAGAVADLDPADGPFLVLDIGGGSTELVAGAGPDDPDLAAVSLQMGCVRVSERYFVDDPPTGIELASARADVAAQLERAV
ncbi:MAG TPA: exopolyphosphatase, partial [Acidimicrobiales bacterium]